MPINLPDTLPANLPANLPVVIILMLYLILLYRIARAADRHQSVLNRVVKSPLVYSLALGVFCTSWTFYGLAGSAAANGWLFMPILLGPVLLFLFGQPLLRRIAYLCRQENTRSIADFLAARYGKRQGVASTVTLIMVCATVPYIALQMKAISDTMLLLLPDSNVSQQQLSMLITTVLITLVIFFDNRRLEGGGYHAGLMSAVAFESLMKLIALVAIAVLAIALINQDSLRLLDAHQALQSFMAPELNYRFVLETLISAAAVLCLPRMFHVTFVELISQRYLRIAGYVFPVYLVITGLCILLISLAGTVMFAGQDIAAETYVMMLPISQGNDWLTLLAFIGGVSAATAMIIVACITLSYMLSNDVVMPYLMHRKRHQPVPAPDYSGAMINSRRATVVLVLVMSAIYHLILANDVRLTDIGLVAFTLAIQVCPPLLFGLYSARGNAPAVYASLIAGCSIWFITLMLPLLIQAGMWSPGIAEQGIAGIAWLRPTYLFNLSFADDFSRAVTLSLLANIAAYWIFSGAGKSSLSDRIQAKAFLNLARARPSRRKRTYLIADLQALLVSFLGESSTRQLIYRHSTPSDSTASGELIDAAEHALAGVVGVTSAIRLLETLDKQHQLDVEDVVNIFEESTRAFRFNQDMIVAAFESMSSAISVMDNDFRLVSWNANYENMFRYPDGVLKVGIPVADLVHFNAERGLLGPGNAEELVEKRMEHLRSGSPYRVVRNQGNRVIEIKGNPLPGGGYVTTYDDISEFIDAQERLEKTRLYLEQRVKERTNELERAQQLAEEANQSKSRFIAHASHDILQPLNAANLYASLLLDQARRTGAENTDIIANLNSAIQSSEHIIGTFLEISKLDTGAMRTECKNIPLESLLEPLVSEFRVQAHDNTEIRYVPTSAVVYSDPRYLRRIIQNFLSNAVKYTQGGKILLGCRHRPDRLLEICVLDTGPGIPEADIEHIFDDFFRSSQQQKVTGIGLGLAVAKRFAELLGHQIQCQSEPGKGSMFSLLVPLGQRQTSAHKVSTAESSPLSDNLTGRRIFCVDDDERNLQALKAVLSDWGCEFESAPGAAAAIESARTEGALPPDLLVVDWHLENGNNGVELTRELRRIWQKEVPGCLVSAAPEPDFKMQAAANRMAFLRKPIKPARLRALLEQLAKKAEVKG